MGMSGIQIKDMCLIMEWSAIQITIRTTDRMSIIQMIRTQNHATLWKIMQPCNLNIGLLLVRYLNGSVIEGPLFRFPL